VESVVQGTGYRVQGSGLKWQEAGFRVQGSSFKWQEAWFRLQLEQILGLELVRRHPALDAGSPSDNNV